MVDHCDSGCCATWFAGSEKTLELAETIPTAQEMPISHLASVISAPLASFIPAHGFIAIPRAKMSRIHQGSRDKVLNGIERYARVFQLARRDAFPLKNNYCHS